MYIPCSISVHKNIFMGIYIYTFVQVGIFKLQTEMEYVNESTLTGNKLIR